MHERKRGAGQPAIQSFPRICLAGSHAALLSLGLIEAAAAADLTDLSLEQLLHVPIYSASKFYEKASDAPSWVTVVTGEDLRQ